MKNSKARKRKGVAQSHEKVNPLFKYQRKQHYRRNNAAIAYAQNGNKVEPCYKLRRHQTCADYHQNEGENFFAFVKFNCFFHFSHSRKLIYAVIITYSDAFFKYKKAQQYQKAPQANLLTNYKIAPFFRFHMPPLSYI